MMIFHISHLVRPERESSTDSYLYSFNGAVKKEHTKDSRLKSEKEAAVKAAEAAKKEQEEERVNSSFGGAQAVSMSSSSLAPRLKPGESVWMRKAEGDTLVLEGLVGGDEDDGHGGVVSPVAAGDRQQK